MSAEELTGLERRLPLPIRALTPANTRRLERIARLEPDMLRSVPDRISASDKYERAVFEMLLGRLPDHVGDETFAESFRATVFLASFLAEVRPGDWKTRGTEEEVRPYRADRLRALFMPSVARVPRPVTEESSRAIAFALWASSFYFWGTNSDTHGRPLDPASNGTDLRFIEEHLDELMARRSFIASRRIRTEAPFEETMKLLRIAAGGSTALLEGAL